MTAFRIGRRPPQRALFLILIFISAAWSAQAATNVAMDTERSSLTVRVYKTGLFSGFAHDHEIHAALQQGSFDEERQTVEFSVNARELRVIDPGVSESDRSQVQTTMLGPKVLDSERFPEIRFHSTRVQRTGDGKWTVEGDLTLHGQTHPAKVEVEGSHAHYRGSALLRQKDFGITPVSIAGGSIKVKDEIRIEFEIFGKQ